MAVQFGASFFSSIVRAIAEPLVNAIATKLKPPPPPTPHNPTPRGATWRESFGEAFRPGRGTLNFGSSYLASAFDSSQSLAKELNYRNVLKTIGINFKANTRGAELSFDQFASRLSKKFLVSGLELSSIRASIDGINRRFSEALQEQGLAHADENLALQNRVGTLFSVLKEGSINAGAAMAENIRRSLGEVSKDIGSTTEDINKIMEIIPVTHKRTLDEMGISMSDFASKALRLQTNVRVGLGEKAEDLLNKSLSGSATIQDMKNDRTGIGQLVYQRFGMMPFEAMAPEQRTRLVAKMLGDEEFQKQIETLAERAGGFQIVFRKFFNTLFDAETGIFGVLKDVTIQFKDFDGNQVSATTTIFKEFTEFIKSIFDPNEGLIAVVAQEIAKTFGFDADSPAETIAQILRFLRDSVNKVKEVVETPVFQVLIEGIEGVFKIIGGISKLLWNLVSRGGFTQKEVDAIQGGVDATVKGLTDGILPFFTNLTKFIGNRIQDILETIIYLAKNINFDGQGLLNAIGAFVKELLSQIGQIVPLAFESINEVIKSLVRNFGGGDNLKKGFLEFLRALTDALNTILDSFHEFILEPLGKIMQSPEFARFFKEIGVIIGPTIARLVDLWVDWFIIQRESLLVAAANLITPELQKSVAESIKKYVAFQVHFFKETTRLWFKMVLPLLATAFTQQLSSGLGAIKDSLAGLKDFALGNAPDTYDFTPPNLEVSPPGVNYETKASGNFFTAVQMEQAQSSVFARPVIANSDEIIIPRGRVRELNMDIENKVMGALSPALTTIVYNTSSTLKNSMEVETNLLDINSKMLAEIKAIKVNDNKLSQNNLEIPSLGVTEPMIGTPNPLLPDFSNQSKDLTEISDVVVDITDIARQINENTKNTQKELVISNLLSSRSASTTHGTQSNNSTEFVIMPPKAPNVVLNSEIKAPKVEAKKESIIEKIKSTATNVVNTVLGRDSSTEKEPDPIRAPIPVFETKAAGNFFSALQMERAQSSVFARPVIANSDEIIIPRGRIRELNTNIETNIVNSLSPVLNNVVNNTSSVLKESTNLDTKLFNVVYSLVTELKKSKTSEGNVSTSILPRVTSFNSVSEKSLLLPEAEAQREKLGGISEMVMSIVDISRQISTNTDKTYRELIISNLFASKGSTQSSSTPPPIPVSDISLPSVSVLPPPPPMPEVDSSIVGQIKETINNTKEVIKNQVENILPAPIPPPPSPQASKFSQAPQTSMETSTKALMPQPQPLQVVLQIDGKEITSVVLSDIWNRTRQIVST
jgi:hypothetical protein